MLCDCCATAVRLLCDCCAIVVRLLCDCCADCCAIAVRLLARSGLNSTCNPGHRSAYEHGKHEKKNAFKGFVPASPRYLIGIRLTAPKTVTRCLTSKIHQYYMRRLLSAFFLIWPFSYLYFLMSEGGSGHTSSEHIYEHMYYKSQ